MKKGTEGTPIYEDIEDMESYKSVNRFKSRVRETTWSRYRYYLRDFFRYLDSSDSEFRGMNPDQLVEAVRDMGFDDRFDMVDVLLGYKEESQREGLRARTLKTRIAIARSFFQHNRANLPADKDLWAVQPTTPPVVGKLTVEDIRDMIMSFNPTYQAVFTCIFQGGMDLDCFIRWNMKGWPRLKETLDKGGTIHEIPLHGRKKTKNLRTFYTFIGKDSLDKIRVYLKDRPEDGTAIFYTRTGKPVSKNSVYLMWLRHLKRLDKITPQGRGKKNRYGKNPHELRDIFVSQFQKSPAGREAGDYFTGHVLDSNGYAKSYEVDPEFRAKQYRDGEPWISLFSDTKPYGTIRHEEYEQRIRELRKDQKDKEKQIQEMYEELNAMVLRVAKLERGKGTEK